jgi:hypothetical protein
MWSLSPYLDGNDKLRLKERGVYRWIHDKRTRLEWLEKAADIPTSRKIIAEKDLIDFRDVTFSK